jgi:transposase
MGTASVEQFVCMLSLGDLVELLRKAGYEKIPDKFDWEAASIRCDSCGNWKIKQWECKACGKEAPNADV